MSAVKVFNMLNETWSDFSAWQWCLVVVSELMNDNVWFFSPVTHPHMHLSPLLTHATWGWTQSHVSTLLHSNHNVALLRQVWGLIALVACCVITGICISFHEDYRYSETCNDRPLQCATDLWREATIAIMWPYISIHLYIQWKVTCHLRSLCGGGFTLQASLYRDHVVKCHT